MGFMLGGFAEGLFGGLKSMADMYGTMQHANYFRALSGRMRWELEQAKQDKANAAKTLNETDAKQRNPGAIPTSGPGSPAVGTDVPTGAMPEPKFAQPGGDPSGVRPITSMTVGPAAPGAGSAPLPARPDTKRAAPADMDPGSGAASEAEADAAKRWGSSPVVTPGLVHSVLPGASAPISGGLAAGSARLGSPVMDGRPSPPIMPAPTYLPQQGMPGTPSGPPPDAQPVFPAGNPMRNQTSAPPLRNQPTALAIGQLHSGALSPQDFDRMYGDGAAARSMPAPTPQQYLPPSQNPAFGPGAGSVPPLTQNQPAGIPGLPSLATSMPGIGPSILAAMNPVAGRNA